MNKSELSLIKKVLWDIELIELKKMESIPSVEWNPSEECKENLKKIFRVAKEQEKRTTLKFKRLRTALIAAILVIATMATLIACVEPVRNFFKEIAEKYTDFISITDDKSKEVIEEIYLPTNLPKNSIEISSNVTEVTASTVWMNGEDVIVVLQHTGNTTTTLDTENSEYGTKRVAGI